MTTQLDRLRELPLTIQWRKEWSPKKQYVKNDAVVSLIDNCVYILIITSNLGGNDPAINSDWFPITSATSGVTNIYAFGGVKNSGTGTNAILDNTGVISVRPGSNISITGTANNPIVNGTANLPRFCLLYVGSNGNSGFPVTPSSVGIITYGTSVSAFFNDCLANGAPDPNGTFYIDLSSINFIKQGSASPNSNALGIYVNDDNLNTSILISRQYSNIGAVSSAGKVSLGVIPLNVAVVRTAGLRAVTSFSFAVPSVLNTLNYKLISANAISAVYSPNR